MISYQVFTDNPIEHLDYLQNEQYHRNMTGIYSLLLVKIVPCVPTIITGTVSVLFREEAKNHRFHLLSLDAVFFSLSCVFIMALPKILL